jgi:hypothetical protein
MFQGSPTPGEQLSAFEDVAGGQREDPPSPTREDGASIERGVLFLNAVHCKAWERFYRVAHEQGRTDSEARDLMAKAAALAIVQHQARQAGK